MIKCLLLHWDLNLVVLIPINNLCFSIHVSTVNMIGCCSYLYTECGLMVGYALFPVLAVWMGAVFITMDVSC